MTDRNRLRVILNNLVANAIKHHDPKKSSQFIHIGTGTADQCFRLSVEDNGRGIDQEHMHNIFNMFYRASENSDGSGLGLYIVKETVGKLAGKIEVESKKGMGSTFTIELPLI